MSYYLETRELFIPPNDNLQFSDKSLHSLHNFSNSPYLNSGYEIKIYNNKIELNSNGVKLGNNEPPTRKKDDIKKFSINSRRRMMVKLSSLNLQLYDKPLFLTLTYQNVYPKSRNDLQKQLNLFLTKIRRLNFNVHYIWRLEFQKRGAPHFHLILLPLKNLSNKDFILYYRKLRKAWQSSIGSWSLDMQRYSVHLERLNSKKNVFNYISKYSTKMDESNDENYSGRRYGSSSNLFLSPIISQELSQLEYALLRNITRAFVKSEMKVSDQFDKYLQYDPNIQVILSLDQIKIILDTFYASEDCLFFDTFYTNFYKLNFAA